MFADCTSRMARRLEKKRLEARDGAHIVEQANASAHS